MTPFSYGRKRSRAAVWLGVLAFAASTLGLNLLLETSRAQYRDPEFVWHARHTAKRMTREPQRELVVVLGTSRTHMGFSPADLGYPNETEGPLVGNFAQSGGTPVYSYMNLQRLLRLGIRPDYILYEIMPAVLVTNDTADQLIPAERMSYADTESVRDYRESSTAWLMPRIAPWFSYRNKILSHHAPTWIPDVSNQSCVWTRPDPCGWLPIEADEWPQDLREGCLAVVKETYRQAFTEFGVAPRSDQAIRDTLRLCRELNIPVVGYRMPESPVYRSWSQPDAQEKLNAYLALLERDFGFRCFDCSTWMPETDFLDGHHLLRAGAKKFSRRFGAECLRPWLEEMQRKNAAAQRNKP